METNKPAKGLRGLVGVSRGIAPRLPAFEPQISKTRSASLDIWRWAERISVIGLFTLALLYTAFATRSVLVPIVLAWVVGTILIPAVDRAVGVGLPRSVAVIVITLAALLIALALIGLLSTPLTYWIGRTEELGDLIREKVHLLSQPLALFDELSKALAEATGAKPSQAGVQAPPSNIVGAILSTITPIVSEFVLFFFALIFYLEYQKQIKQGIVAFFTDDGVREMAKAILDDAEKNTSTYFGTLLIVNICLGFVATLLAWSVGLPHPSLWGVLAGTLNFVPYLGPAVTVAALFAVGLLSFNGVGHAVIAPVAYIAVTTIEGQLITPTIVGHRLTLNPFLVFLSIAFWTWMWGPIGAFLAVPLLIASVVVIRHIAENNRTEDVSV